MSIRAPLPSARSPGRPLDPVRPVPSPSRPDRVLGDRSPVRLAACLAGGMLLALAGCVDDPPTDPGEEPGDGGDPPVRWRVVDAGDGYTCGLDRQGTAYCWGARAGGALGDGGSGGTADRPVPVLGGRSYDSLDVGRHHACGLTTDGRAWCWGRNDRGQLGTPTSGSCTVDGDRLDCSRRPVRAAPSLTFAGLTAGGSHTCAVTGETRLFCWGSNGSGQLGVGGLGGATTTPQNLGLGWISAAAGGFHTCGLDGLNNVLCWGGNAHGQLGDGSRIVRTAPSAVAIQGASSMTAGLHNSCILAPAFCWGRGTEGQIGNDVLLDAIVPIRVGGEAAFAQLDAGAFHVCGVTEGEGALCWGQGSDGQLGTGQATDVEGLPVSVAGDRAWARVAAGHGHTCGVTVDGGAFCWGRNDGGQLGDGSLEARTAPVPVAEP